MEVMVAGQGRGHFRVSPDGSSVAVSNLIISLLDLSKLLLVPPPRGN